MIKHLQIDQNSEEWFNARLGHFTASSFKDLFAAKSTAQYQKAINKVVFERLTGEVPESFSNDYMERGHELEPIAKEVYSMQTFNDVIEGGFFCDDWIGASPDGLVGPDGLIEVKSPAYNTMINYLLNPSLPSEYKWQVYGQLYITGRAWCDFMAYHPKLKPLIIRIYPDEAIFNELKAALKDAIEMVEKRISLIQ